ncbi:uncharacterized protein LOC103039637 [Astyanax mexicanus]|uniref:uncharacterized protein LOC103039637 n=1 Tax=Astyanax mexicanus TaxID=7994 RepID=UPI000BBDC025|nr:uncharacterized protein LOC103039637 [Astyanax mexicanus]
MSSGCCPSSVCLCEESVIRSGAVPEEETSDDEAPTNMDIALLKEQYNSIREKQKRETRVVCFRKAASNNEEISGKALVNVVPMRQARRSLMRQASLQDTHFDFVRDHESSPWRTHLGMYRRTCAAVDPNQHKHTKVKTSTGDSISSTSVGNGEHSVEITDSSGHLSEECEGVDDDKCQKDYSSEETRKFSAPEILTRRLSSSSSCRSNHSTTSAYHYPFPQLKSPRKSEAARRLGLYSSF